VGRGCQDKKSVDTFISYGIKFDSSEFMTILAEFKVKCKPFLSKISAIFYDLLFASKVAKGIPFWLKAYRLVGRGQERGDESPASLKRVIHSDG